MFSTVAKFKFEAALAVIVALFVGYFVWNYNHKDVVIDQLKTSVVTEKVENAGLTKQVKDEQASAKISESVDLQVKKDTQALQQKGRVIQKKVDTVIQQVEKRYEDLPDTQDNQVAKELAVNTVIVDGMWDTFCTVKPDDNECRGSPPSGQ